MYEINKKWLITVLVSLRLPNTTINQLSGQPGIYLPLSCFTALMIFGTTSRASPTIP